MPRRQPPSSIQPATVADLTPDPKNARKHNARNVGTIADALKDVGAARSIVIDESGTILAGNATCQAAAQAGITKIHVVDADGQTLVAVRRVGLTPEQKAKLALYDNRTAELADGWDVDILRELSADLDLSSLFQQDELQALLGDVPGSAPAEPGSLDAGAEPLPADRFGVIVLCDDEVHQARVYEELLAAGHRVRVVVV